MLAQCEDQVLSRHAASLRSSEEKGKDFINDTDFSILEVFVYKQYGEEITSFGKLWILLYSLPALIYDILAEISKSFSVALLITLIRSDMVASKLWEKIDVRSREAIDEV